MQLALQILVVYPKSYPVQNFIKTLNTITNT